MPGRISSSVPLPEGEGDSPEASRVRGVLGLTPEEFAELVAEQVL
jgi:hypothetical protein